VANRYVTVPMTFSDLERRDTRVKFFRRVDLITLVAFDHDQIRQYNTCREGCSSRGFARRRGQVLPNIGGSFLFMRTPFASELQNFTW